MKKRRLLMLIMLGVFLIYFSGIAFFTFYALPNTYVNGYNLSYVEKSKIIDRNSTDNELTVKASNNRKLKLSARDVDFTIKVPDGFKIEQNPFSWPLSFFDSKKYTINFDYTINEDKLNQVIDKSQINKNAKKSYDAYISFINDEYIIVPEEEGDEIDIPKLKDTIKKSMLQQKEEVELKDEYITPQIYTNSTSIIQAKNKLNSIKDIEISFDFNDTVYKLKGRNIRNMIGFDEKKGFIYKEKEIEEYIEKLKDKTDTYDKKRNITTIEGKNITLQSTDYGWQIDTDKTQQLIKQTLEKRKDATIEPIYTQKAKSRQTNDISDEYIEIDTDKKMLYYINNYDLITSIPYQSKTKIEKGIYNLDLKEKGYSDNYTIGFYNTKISDKQTSDIIINKPILEKLYFDTKDNIAVIVY